MSEELETIEPMVPVEREAEHRLPNLLHLLVFVTIAVVAIVVAGVVVLGATMGVMQLPGFRHMTFVELASEPIMMMAAQAVGYAGALLIAGLIFSEWWQTSFSKGIEWNWEELRGRHLFYLGGGLLLGLLADLGSNYLPVPKTPLPVDEMFKHTSAVWVIAIFGVTLGPLFEEITFRGFMQPAVETAWTWAAGLIHFRKGDVGPGIAIRYTALAFSTLVTSLAFIGLHSPQLAGTPSVLCLLFLVSVTFCMVRYMARSVAASTLAHAGYNLCSFIFMFIATGGFMHLERLRH